MDTLTNVNIEDDERTKKSHQNVKDFKEGYKAYDSEVIDEFTGEVKSLPLFFNQLFCLQVQKKELLYQYKESLEGEKKESFTLEAEGEFSEEVKRERELAKIRLVFYYIVGNYLQPMQSFKPRCIGSTNTSTET